MNFVIFHVLDHEPTADGGTVRFAAPALSPEERVALWEGVAPEDLPSHPAIAPVVLIGELDGRPVYTEQVPRGVRVADAAPPAALMPFVVLGVLEGLARLHAERCTHGTVGPGRIVLGEHGEVVLIGTGRRSASMASDVIAAISLLPTERPETLPDTDARRIAAGLRERVEGGAAARLGAWGRGHLTDVAPRGEPVVVLAHAGTDEVVPDLGPEDEGVGLLDRWGVTATGGSESTSTGSRGVGTAPEQAALELWSRLAGPLRHEPPADRFAAVDGVPSRAIRALLADEPLDALPLALIGAPPPSEAEPLTLDLDDEATATRTVVKVALPGRLVPAWLLIAGGMAAGALLTWLLLGR